MASEKISQMPAISSFATGDLLPIVDISEFLPSDRNKSVTFGELFRNVLGGSASAPSIAFTGDQNTGIYSPGADQVAISTNGTGRLFVDASGNVGVSEATPGSYAIGTGAPTLVFKGTSVSTRSGGTAFVTQDGTSGKTYLYHDAGLFKIQSETATSIAFDTNNTERLRITSDGKVGLGTSSPWSLLTVGSGGTANPAATTSIHASTHSEFRLKLTSSNYATAGNWLGLGFGFSDNYLKAAILAEAQDQYGKTNLHFCLNNSTSSANASLSDSRLVITPSGNVGVGTTSPQRLLHVHESAAATNGYIQLTNAATGSASTNGLQLLVASPGKEALIIQRENANLEFWTNNTERARIDSSGRLGIGTSSPSNLFQSTQSISRSSPPAAGASGHELALGSSSYGIVAGTTTGGSSYIASTRWDGTATNYSLLLNPNGGNVGVGTTSPTGPLQINMGTNKNIVFTGGLGEVGSVPAFQGINDAGSALTSIGMRGTDIRFACGSAERARIDSSGRLLVGTSSAYVGYGGSSNNKLQIAGSAYTDAGISAFVFGSTPVGGYLNLGLSRNTATGSHTVVQSGDAVGSITFNGSDGTTFKAAADISCYVDGTPGTNDMPGRLVFSTTADGASSPTERMRIGNSGDVYIANTTATPVQSNIAGAFTYRPSGQLEINGNATQAAFFGRTNDGMIVGFYSGGTRRGDVSISGSTCSFNNTSDYRLKENIASIGNAVTRLNQLKPCRFNFIDEPSKTVDGFIAHEAQAVVPEAVTGEKDAEDADGNPVYQGIDQSKLVPLLTAALQEAVAKIESLEARLTAAGI